MKRMPKWLIPLIVAAWAGAGYSAYLGTWIPLLVFAGLGILAATSAAGVLWANRSALGVAQRMIDSGQAAKADHAVSPEQRRDETKKRQERNRRRRRKS